MKLPSRNFSLNNILIFLFLFSIFLIKIYPLYFLPVQNPLFSSHTLSKLLIVSVFLILFVKKRIKIQNTIQANKFLFLIIFLFILFQTLSILPASDVGMFLKTYHNTVVSLIIFFSVLFLFQGNGKRALNKLTLFVIFTGFISVSIETFFRLFFPYLFPIFSLLVQKEIVNAYMVNISQGKYSLAIGNEIFIPFFMMFVFLIKRWNFKRLIIFAFLLATAFWAVLSNFRIRLLLLLLTFLISTAVLFSKKIKFFRLSIKNIFMTFFFIVLSSIILILALYTSESLYSFNVFDRFFLEGRYLDLGPVNTRMEQIYKSIQIFESHPLLGVGLGNYPYYAEIKLLNNPARPYEKDFVELSLSRPHNIFFQLLAETGILGFIPFVVLLLYFLKRDLQRLKAPLKNQIWPYIISSWSVVVYALFNPADTLFITGWFWFLRGIIEIF